LRFYKFVLDKEALIAFCTITDMAAPIPIYTTVTVQYHHNNINSPTSIQQSPLEERKHYYIR